MLSSPAPDEEQKKSDDYDGKDDPAHPVVPGTITVAASPAIVVVVTPSHAVLDWIRW
jgi:hypothetical protein